MGWPHGCPKPPAALHILGMVMFSSAPDTSRGDALIFEAITELKEHVATAALLPQHCKTDSLSRALLRLDHHALQDRFHTWRRVAAMIPLEDEIFSTQRNLQRAHGLLKTAVSKQR